MDIKTFFLQRYQYLHDSFLPGLRENLSEKAFRERPVPGTQPISWLLWHIARVEDIGLSRFVWDAPQLLNEDWQKRMNSTIPHYGTSMTDEETAEFGARVKLEGLHDYHRAVYARTKEQLAKLDETRLGRVLDESTVLRIVRDEGMASEVAQWVTPHYVGKTIGWTLCHFGLTHNFRHFGQIVTVRKIWNAMEE